MSHTIPTTGTPSALPPVALYAQAAIVLRITAQQWGICTQQRSNACGVGVRRKLDAAADCAPLRTWSMAV